MKKKLTHLSLFFILSGALFNVIASPTSLIDKGNRAFQQGSYDEALIAYEAASIEAPESPHIYFNKGTIFYMQGDYQKATDMFEQAALKTKDLAFEARAQFNLGNCAFRESLRQRDSDLKKSVEQLERSIYYYKKAFELDPELQDAAHNIEVARLIMKQLLDEVKKLVPFRVGHICFGLIIV